MSEYMITKYPIVVLSACGSKYGAGAVGHDRTVQLSVRTGHPNLPDMSGMSGLNPDFGAGWGPKKKILILMVVIRCFDNICGTVVIYQSHFNV